MKPMLTSMILMLCPLETASLPMTLGNALYTVLLRLIGDQDAALATWLHDLNGPKPLTTSLLNGPITVRDKRVWVSPEQTYWVRATSFEPQLTAALMAIQAQPPRTMRLHQAPFAVEAVSCHPDDHPWAAQVTYDDLYRATLQTGARGRPQVTLEFSSPTAFRSQGRTHVFPLPHLVFGSLMTRWNAYAHLPLDPDFLGTLDAYIDIDRYRLNTQMQDFGRYQLQIGFVGPCAYGARKGAPDDVVWGMRLLTQFAFFAGVGYRTTMGMGQVRVGMEIGSAV